MHASNIFAVAAAGLAAAAPVSSLSSKEFAVTNFSFGCTAGCYYNFDLTVTGSADHFPADFPPVKCSGSLEDTTYVNCGTVSETQTLSAYIVKDTNELKLKYTTSDYTDGAVYNYFGQTEVYSATGSDASKQKVDFTVPVSSATATA